MKKEFEYFTDAIVLDAEKMNNEIDVEPLDNFMDSVKIFFEEMDIDIQNITFFYKRNKKGSSVLGIQLANGDIDDISNYLVYDCLPRVSGEDISCDIGMHVSDKISLVSMKFASLTFENVITFFNMMEKKFIKREKFNVELDYMKSIFLQKRKTCVLTKILKRK